MTLLIGLVVGLVLGLTGAGGSVLAVPLFILLLGLDTTNAMGLALGAVAVGAAYGVLLQRKNVMWAPAIALALGGMLTAPVGKYVALLLPSRLLVLGFGVLAVLIALRMWRQAVVSPAQARVVRGAVAEADQGLALCRLSATGQFQLRPKCISGLVAGGLVIGFASGLFGVGGGFLIVPMLLFLSQASMSHAVASSLLAITLISGMGFVGHVYMSGMPEGVSLVALMGASLVGMLVSQLAGRFIAGPVLQKVFAVTLILVSVFTVAKVFNM